MKVQGSYADQGYALIEGLLSREVANAFLQQVDADMKAAGTPLGSQTAASAVLKREAIEFYGYHYRPMLMLLWGLTPVMEKLTGRPLLPTYNYFRIYREGDVCRVHSDRHACEHSLSLTLDYSDGVPWDLEIGREHRAEPLAQMTDQFDEPFDAVAMQPGDAVVYRGVNHRHGRTKPNPNGWSAHLFLHWVDREGPYAASAFEGNAAATRPINVNFG